MLSFISTEQGVDAQASKHDGNDQDVVQGERVVERTKRGSLQTCKSRDEWR